MREKNRLLFGLFFLRIGLGCFLLFSGLDKMINPLASIEKINLHYSIAISHSIAVLLGSCLLVFSLFFILASYKNFTYITALLLHLFTSFMWFLHAERFFASQNDLFAHIALLFAFLALYICRDFDTKFSFDRKKSLFSS